jgi:hypothetical protein
MSETEALAYTITTIIIRGVIIAAIVLAILRALKKPRQK